MCIVRRLLFLLWVVALSAGSSSAQDATTGAISGTVLDSAKHAIAGAHITLIGQVGEATSLQDGRFYLFHLAPGKYRLSVSQKGFAALNVRDVEVTLGQTTAVEITLMPSDLQGITVTASSIDTEDAPTSVTVSPAQMQHLPVDSNRWQSFALLAPTVTSSDAMEQQLSFGGMAVAQNQYLIQGMDDTRDFSGEIRGGSRVALHVPQSAVREFRIHPTDYTTSMGGAAGGVISTITDRGSDRLHGSTFFQYRGDVLAAHEPFAIATRYNNGSPTNTQIEPHDRRLQWGGKLSGPVSHGLSYLVAYEQLRRIFPAVSTPSNANFYNLTPVQVGVLRNRGVTLTQIDSALSYLDSLSGKVARSANTVVTFSRVDWDRSADHLMLSWNLARVSSPAGVRLRTAVARAMTSFGDDAVHTDDVTLRWTHLFTSNLTHQLGVSLSRDEGSQQAQQPLPQEPHSGPNGYSPQVSIQGEFTLGKPTTLGRRHYPDERRAQLLDILSWAGPQSLLQAGFSAGVLEEHIEALSSEEGAYNYSSTMTSGHAGGLVDFITDYTFSSSSYPNGGCPAIYATVHDFCFHSYTQGFGRAETNWHTLEGAAFVQQQWRPSRSITLDAGLRYESLRLPSAQHPNAALDAVFGDFAATSSLPSDTNNLAPRVALAWSRGTGSPTVVRLSYGVYFGRITGATVWSALSRTSQTQSTYSIHMTSRTQVNNTCNSYGSNFGYPSTFLCIPYGEPQQTTSTMLFARGFQAPMVQRAQLSIEQQIHTFVLKMAYLGTAARQLPNSTDINIAPSAQTATFRIMRDDARGEAGTRNGDSFRVPLYTARIMPGYGPVTAILSNATAASHAMIVGLQRPLRNGYSMQASWTYSKMLDYGQSHAAVPDTNGQFDPFDIRYDRAASDLDHRHRILASAMVQPRVHGTKFMEAAWNNWSASATFMMSSGRPYSYLITGGTELVGGVRASMVQADCVICHP